MFLLNISNYIFKIDDLNQNINDLVRELAIKNEIILEDEKDKKE